MAYRMSPRRVVAALHAGVLLACSTASAAPNDIGGARGPLQLRLDGAGCTAVRLDEVLPLAHVELGSRLADPSAPEASVVAVRCSGDLVTISGRGRDKVARFYRTDLSSTPAPARLRVVAVAIAEAVHDLDLAPAPAPPAPAPPASRTEGPKTLAPEGTSASTGTMLGAFWQTMRFASDNGWLNGGGLRFAYAGNWWTVGFDTSVLTDERTSQLGSTRTILAGVSPHVGGRWVQGPFAARAGAGFSFGVAQIKGSISDPARAIPLRVTGPWGGPFAFVGASYALTGGLAFDASAQAGYTSTADVIGEVDGGSNVNLKGLWGGMQLGLALSL